MADLPQLTAPLAPPALPAAEPTAAEPAAAPKRLRKVAPTSAPRRPFALTQQAAASMEAGGMDVAQIASALGITERQVRNALKPVPVTKGGQA